MLNETRQFLVLGLRGFELARDVGKRLIGRLPEEVRDAFELPEIGGKARAVNLGEFLFDLGAECVDADFMRENFDPRLVFVVAATFEIVDAKDGFEIAEQRLPRHEVAQDLAFHRRAAKAAANQHLVAERLRLRVAQNAQAHVVRLERGAVMRGAGDGDLEFAAEPLKLGMQARPLPDPFGGRRADPRFRPRLRRRIDRKWCCGCNCRRSGCSAFRHRQAG